jgi:hypothetical protein
MSYEGRAIRLNALVRQCYYAPIVEPSPSLSF